MAGPLQQALLHAQDRAREAAAAAEGLRALVARVDRTRPRLSGDGAARLLAAVEAAQRAAVTAQDVAAKAADQFRRELLALGFRLQ